VTEELQTLWSLHELDERLVIAQEALSRYPEERAGIERRLAEERTHLETHKQVLHDHQLKHRELEKDIAALEVEERKYQSQLPMVKKNEEYQALLHEISLTKSKRSERETDLLVRMEEESRLAGQRPAIEQSLAKMEQETSARLAAIAAEEQRQKEAVDALDARRKDLAGRLPPNTRARYERIRASRGGRAVVPILPKGACGGCFRGQPPQVLQEARRGDRVLLCDGCGRMMVWPPMGA
jgi:predicted  nucleic acid-binding Zn-ribbon protein